MNMLYDIFVSFVGAFLGFLFALLSEAVISSYARSKDIRAYLTNIREELSEIRKVLNDNKDDIAASFMFDVPLLEAFIASGEVRHILKKSYYKTLISINTKIKKANEIEEARDNPDLIIIKRQGILEVLDELLSNSDFIGDAPLKHPM